MFEQKIKNWEEGEIMVADSTMNVVIHCISNRRNSGTCDGESYSALRKIVAEYPARVDWLYKRILQSDTIDCITKERKKFIVGCKREKNNANTCIILAHSEIGDPNWVLME